MGRGNVLLNRLIVGAVGVCFVVLCILTTSVNQSQMVGVLPHSPSPPTPHPHPWSPAAPAPAPAPAPVPAPPRPNPKP